MMSVRSNSYCSISAIIFFLAFAFSGCLRRSFNVPYQDRNLSVPADSKGFSEALYDGARRSLNEFSRTDLEAFFESFSVDDLKAGEKQKFIEAIAYQCPFEFCLKRSAVSPVWLSKTGFGGIPSGGLILFRNDLFPEGYFRQRGKLLPLKDLMTRAPWFEWDASQRIYIPRKGGAPARILKSMFLLRGEGSDFELFRGAGTNLAGFVPPDRNPYDSGGSEAMELNFFSSPSINTALSWARPAVWSSKVPRHELLEAVSGEQPLVYVGFEYNYTEIAFLRSKVSPQPIFLKNGRARVLCVSKERMTAEPNPAGSGTGTSGAEFSFCDSTWVPAHASGFPEALTKVKSATTRKDALLKLSAIPDGQLPEGHLFCKIPRGTQISYLDAVKMQGKQVWIHSRGLKPEWNCPRGFASEKFYMDEDNLSIEVTD